MTAAGFLAPPLGSEAMASAPELPGPAGQGVEFFVAVDGNDANPGTEASPFATLGRARKAVREARRRSPERITVWVREGTHYLREPLIMGPEDSGKPNAPVTYAAYGAESVTVSGGRRLECHWVPYKNGIMMCELRDVKPGRLNFTQLFVNGKRQIRARYPNYDHKNPLVSGTGYINAGRDWSNVPPSAFPYDPQTFTSRRWSKPQEAVVHIFQRHYWGNCQWEVESVDWQRHLIKLGWGGFQINDRPANTEYKVSNLLGRGSRFYVENVFEELDAPGEWYLSREEGRLYYMPEEGLDLGRALAEVPILENAIEFRGSQRNPVKYIVFSGFRVAHTESTYLSHYDAPSRGDWTLHRGGAVFAEGAEDCSIEKCFFDAVGGNAVFVNNYNRRIRIRANKFVAAGDSAICLVGEKGSVQGTQQSFPGENIISNNLIHDCGVFGKQIAGVFISISERNTVSHNLIYNMPRAGICINDGWGGGQVIEFNKVHDTVLETKDHGPFNSWGRSAFWCLQQSHGPISHGAGNVRAITRYPIIIRHNYFRENRRQAYFRRNNLWGIDLDDGSSNTHIYNNLCVGIGVKLREGDYRLVENNIFVDPGIPPAFQVGYEYNHDRFLRNIIVISRKDDPFAVGTNPQEGKDDGPIYEVVFPPLHGPIAREIDYNVFYSDAGEFFATIRPRGSKAAVRHTLDEWRGLGFDRHSVYADPMFVDPGKGDYRVQPESPALRLGFRNFDISRAGLLPDFPDRWRED